jgi:hypothetical protein
MCIKYIYIDTYVSWCRLSHQLYTPTCYDVDCHISFIYIYTYVWWCRLSHQLYIYTRTCHDVDCHISFIHVHVMMSTVTSVFYIYIVLWCLLKLCYMYLVHIVCSRSRDCGSWIYNYLCNQCISPLKLSIRIPTRTGRGRAVYSIPHYVIKFVSDLRQVGGFLRFPPRIKLIATI